MTAFDVAQGSRQAQRTAEPQGIHIGALSDVPNTVEAGQTIMVTVSVTADLETFPETKTYEFDLAFVGGDLASRDILKRFEVDLAAGQTKTLEQGVTVTSTLPPNDYELELSWITSEPSREILWREPIRVEEPGSKVGVIATDVRVTNRVAGERSELIATTEGVGQTTQARTFHPTVTDTTLPSVTVTRSPGEVGETTVPFTVPGGRIEQAVATFGSQSTEFAIQQPDPLERITGFSVEEAALATGVVGATVGGLELMRRRGIEPLARFR